MGIRFGEKIEDQRDLHLQHFPFWYQVVLMPELVVGLNDISLKSPGMLPLLYGVGCSEEEWDFAAELGHGRSWKSLLKAIQQGI